MLKSITITNIKLLGDQEENIFLQDIVKFRRAQDHSGAVFFTKDSITEDDGRTPSSYDKAIECAEIPKETDTISQFIELHDDQGAFHFNPFFISSIANTPQGAKIRLSGLDVVLPTIETKEDIQALCDKVQIYADYARERTLEIWSERNPDRKEREIPEGVLEKTTENLNKMNAKLIKRGYHIINMGCPE